ncbi:MAG: hypothetical protein V7752_14450 [Halopseudomonas sp.]
MTTGLIACTYQSDANASDPANTWQTTVNLQQHEIGRCELSSKADHHTLSLNGLGNFVITVHQGPDITYELLVDQKLFRGDLRLPARASDRILLFDTVTSQSLLNSVASGDVLTLVEKYALNNKKLRHDFKLVSFKPAYQEYERCLSKS